MNARWTPDEHVHVSDERHPEELRFEGDGSQIGWGLAILALSAAGMIAGALTLVL